MKISSIDFPARLLRALRDDNLVVFAGTGVSMGHPGNLLNFKYLAKKIAHGSGISQKRGEPVDRFLGRLQNENVDLYQETAKIFGEKDSKPAPLHRDLLRLFGSHNKVRIVTTNYDLLFEDAAKGLKDKNLFTDIPEVFSAPALPSGKEFRGIVHIHGALGCIIGSNNYPPGWVMTQADFGRAYLTEGWARRFLVDLFRGYNVLFIGYSHNDLIVNYLSSALATAGRRECYALDYGNSSKERWEYFGIELIPYMKQGCYKHASLKKGISDLADLINRGSDSWKQRISSIAQGKPPAEPDKIDEIEWALRDATGKEGIKLTRYFTEAAREPEWIDYLDNISIHKPQNSSVKSTGNFLDPLFNDAPLDERYRILSSWLTQHYTVQHTDKLIALIGKHGMRLNAMFWQDIALVFDRQQNIPIEPAKLSQWIAVLLNSFSNYFINVSPDSPLLCLGECCVLNNADDCLLDVFDIMADWRLSWQRGDVNLRTVVHSSMLNLLWNSHDNQVNRLHSMKQNLDRLAGKLLPRMIRKLETWHSLMQQIGKDPILSGTCSYQRPSIEDLHGRGDISTLQTSMNIIIDIARDCLESMLKNELSEAVAWRERLVQSKFPLLRRLALHVLTEDPNIPASQKADWLMLRFGLCDENEQHEIYRVLQRIYPKLNEAKRSEVITAILEWKFPLQDIPDLEKTTDRYHYDLLHWLDEAINDQGQSCLLLLNAMEPIDKKYPEWKPTENPDLIDAIRVCHVGLVSPYTADELLAQPPAKWLQKLLDFQDQPFTAQANRAGIIHELEIVARRNSHWAHELSVLLIERQLWESDLWRGIFRGWEQNKDAELDVTQFGQVLDIIENVNLWTDHAYAISNILYSLVKDQGISYAVELFPRTHAIAKELWERLNANSTNSQVTDDWVFYAINHTPGILAQYWIRSLSLWLQQQKTSQNKLMGEYREVLTIIAADSSERGHAGRAILAEQYCWLFYLDEQWTRKHLLPFFSLMNNQGDDFKSVWQGFLYQGYVDPNSWSSTEASMLAAIPQFYGNGLLTKKRDRFIELATVLIGFYVKDPLKKWIPALLKDADDSTRAHFARQVGIILGDLSAEQQCEWWTRWLKLYWQKRINGIPSPPIGDEESSAMLTWLPCLTAVFDEAVDVAVGMQNVQPTFNHIMPYFSRVPGVYNQTFVSEHSSAFAKLLDYCNRIARDANTHPEEWQQIKSWLGK